MVTVGEDPLLGMVIEGRYRIQSVIGQGSAGTVYKAVQELIGREVAIKVLHEYLVSDEEFIKRFRQEAKASSRLSHPNIITIYDFGVIPQGNRPYIAMDLLVGTPLSDYLAENERVALNDAIPLLTQVCSALGEAHRHGVVHRDVKPENIVLVERSGQKLYPMVVDFGIARIVEESESAKITRTGTVCGSPTYMSPEQCTSSKVDSRSDIYSIGIVIYETLTGEVPFHSDELIRVMSMHLSEPPKPLNQVKPGLLFPDALEEVVNKALSKNPNDRFQTMEEMAAALEESIKAPVKPQAPPQQRNASREIEPGPLAQDEHLHRRNTSQEVSVPAQRGTGAIDYAALAMEEYRTQQAQVQAQSQSQLDPATASMADINALNNTSEADRIAEQVAAMRQQMRQAQSESQKGHQINKSDFVKGRSEASVLQKVVLPSVLAILAVAILIFTLGPQLFKSGDDVAGSNEAQEAKKLIGQGKYQDALKVYNTLNSQGKLNAGDKEEMNHLYVRLGEQQGNAGKTEEAIAYLKKVDNDSSFKAQAGELIGKYSGGKKTPPSSGKRRKRQHK
ncbi:MAG: serine/threonine-protein kinase [Candidatus Melainabacteria bacterium]|nr:serine/threonine-protein kinase [Candidatus Melainabacteria bacterium]